MAGSSGWLPEPGEPGQEYPPGPGATGWGADPPQRVPAGNQTPPGAAWNYPQPPPAHGAGPAAPLPGGPPSSVPTPGGPLPGGPVPGGPVPGAPFSPPETGNRKRGGRLKIAVAAGAAVVFLAVALIAGSAGDSALTRRPTAAELSSAAAAAVAQRWERLSAGQIFPGGIGYSTTLLTQETAKRVGIATSTSCATSLDSTLSALAAKSGCHAALRAAYVDELQGVVYTVGVLAFASPQASHSFLRRIPAQAYPATGLQPLALPGTPAARFDDAARQASSVQQAGPYIVLAVAGYADGRPAARGDERRSSVFAPISQMISAVATPLGKPATVDCEMRTQWAC